MSSPLPPVISASANNFSLFYPEDNDIVMTIPSPTCSLSEVKEEMFDLGGGLRVDKPTLMKACHEILEGSKAAEVTNTRRLSVAELDMNLLVDMSSYSVDSDTTLESVTSSVDEVVGWSSLLPFQDQFTFTHAVQSFQPEWLIDAQPSEDDFHFDLPPCDIGPGQFDFLEPSYFVRTPLLEHAFESLQDEVVEAVDNTPSAPPPTPNVESEFSSVATCQPPGSTRWSKRARKPRVVWTPKVTVSPRKRKLESSSLGPNAKKAKLDGETVSANCSPSKSTPRVVRPCRPGTRSSPRKKVAPKPMTA